MPLPDIASEAEEGFHDLVFALTKLDDRGPGGQVLRAAGRTGGHTVAFEVQLGRAWKEGKLGDTHRVTYQGTVTLASVGEESDAFARALDDLYGTKLLPTAMSPQTVFTAISLAGNPANVRGGSVKLKLFFEPADETGYAEVFLNIEFASSRIYLREKDPEYRGPLLFALGTFGDAAVP